MKKLCHQRHSKKRLKMKRLMIILVVFICADLLAQQNVVFDSTQTIEVFWRHPLPWEPGLIYTVYGKPLHGSGLIYITADTVQQIPGNALMDTVKFYVTAMDTALNESARSNSAWAYYIIRPEEPAPFEPMVFSFTDLMKWKIHGPVALNIDEPPHEDGLYLWGAIGECYIRTTFKATEPGSYAIRVHGNGYGDSAFVVVDAESRGILLRGGTETVILRLTQGYHQLTIRTLSNIHLTGDHAVEIRIAVMDMEPPGAPRGMGVRVK